MLGRSFVVSVLAASLALVGCAESHGTCLGACADASAPDASAPDARIADDARTSCLPHAPAVHRAAASTCDSVRPAGATPDPAWESGCASDADCTEGTNGRCTGGREGWFCTYDECFEDDECGGTSVCQCEGSFRSDANSCQASNCRTDGDCASGFCSPTLGSCGDFTGTIGWYCHTCEDECVDDADCAGGDAGPWGRPYCAFEPTAGRWQCMNTHCAG